MLLIFDIDGVLADFTKLKLLRDQVHIKAIAQKHNITEKDAEILFQQIRTNNKKLGRFSTADAMLSLGISKEEFFTIMNSVPIENNIAPTRNIKEVLSSLSKKHTIVALTNTPFAATKRTLEYLQVADYFKKIYSIDKYSYTKPSVEIFKIIMTENNCTKAFSVGDSYEKDLAPAKTAGIKTILFSDRIDSRADFTIDSFSELKRIIDNLRIDGGE